MGEVRLVANTKKTRELKTWHVVLLILGAPLWFSLLITAAGVVLSLVVSAWAMVISFYGVAVSLLACGLAGVLSPVILIPLGKMGVGAFGFGAGLFCAGLGILWFMGTNYMAKGVAWLCKKLFTAFVPGKGAAK